MQAEPNIEFVRELDGWRCACLVRRPGPEHEYFVVSTVDAPITGPETLVFAASEDGEVNDFIEVAGGRGMSREEAIADLGGS